MDMSQFAHEQVVIRQDERSGLTAIIALHSTRLGPAAGGCRRWRYAALDDALTDALRLSAGMTYKNALAGLPFGGGKSVILADAGTRPTEAQLAVFADWLNELDGRYVTAEDVGMGVAEMRTMARRSRYVSGLGEDGIGGDPSPKTAYGVFLGLKTAVQYRLGVEHLHGIRVAVQGLGNVGMSLCHWLARAGAELYVTDIDAGRVREAVERFGATGILPDALLDTPVEVFAPCALGGVIDDAVASTISAQVIAGAANNQLTDPGCGDTLAARGIVYAPDFVINAGGVVSVAHEYLAQQDHFTGVVDYSSERWVGERIDAISHRLLDILQEAEARGVSTETIAVERAQKIVDAGADHAAAAA